MLSPDKCIKINRNAEEKLASTVHIGVYGISVLLTKIVNLSNLF